MSAANSLADYSAAAVLQSSGRGHQRGRSGGKGDWRSGLPLRRRRHSADFSRRHRNLAGLSRQSLDVRSSAYTPLPPLCSPDSHQVCTTLCLSPRGVPLPGFWTRHSPF